VEALLTIAIGFALTFIHRWVERLVDRVIFRKRHLAEKRIEYRIEALGFSESESAVDEALSRDAPEILAFASAAVFRRAAADAPFARAGSSGWPAGCADTIESDTLLVRSLRAMERLARAAGAAYAAVEARRWRERVASLERSLGTATPA
jgi:hypothetical protein